MEHPVHLLLNINNFLFSFIAVTGVSDAPAPPDHKSKEMKLGAFKIKLDDKDDLAAGTYFNKRLVNSGIFLPLTEN